MKKFLYYGILLLVVVKESKETECLTCGKNLKCKFNEDLNLAHKDFSVFFYPVNGSEESLADCKWHSEGYDCIEVKDVKCQHSVSDIAVISLPTRFVSRAGNFKCKADGDGLESIIPCHFPERQGNDQNASCEATTVSDEGVLIVNISLPIDVESFQVELDEKMIFNYTIEEYKRSSACNSEAEITQDIFTVQLNVSGDTHVHCTCSLNHPTSQHEVIECTSSRDTNTEVSLVVVILPLLFVVGLLIAAATILLLRKRRSRGCCDTASPFCGDINYSSSSSSNNSSNSSSSCNSSTSIIHDSTQESRSSMKSKHSIRGKLNSEGRLTDSFSPILRDRDSLENVQ